MSLLPNELFYSKDHEWAKIEGEYAYVGITEHAQGELGDIVFVDMPKLSSSFRQDDCFGSVEAVKTVSELFMPLSGEVVEVNEKLADEPELINSDPYGQGWMLKIKLSNPAETENLLNAQGYAALIA